MRLIGTFLVKNGNQTRYMATESDTKGGGKTVKTGATREFPDPGPARKDMLMEMGEGEERGRPGDRRRGNGEGKEGTLKVSLGWSECHKGGNCPFFGEKATGWGGGAMRVEKKARWHRRDSETF